MAKRCYYEVLEVERSANDGTLKSAFRKLAMQWHPDRNPTDKNSEHRFKEINEAYEVLKDPDKRAAYDRFGHAAFEQGVGPGGAGGFGADFGSTFSDLFEGIFGMSGARGRSGRERGADLRYNMEIDLDGPTPARPPRYAFRPRSSANLPGTGAKAGSARLVPLRRRRPRRHARGFHAGAHLHGLPGPRPGDRQSCRRARLRAPTRERALSVNIPWRRGRDSYPSRQRRRGRRARRPAGDLYIFLSIASHPFFQRRRRPHLCADLDGGGGPRRGTKCRPSRRQDPRRCPKGPNRAAVSACRARACRCCDRSRSATCMFRSWSRRRKSSPSGSAVTRRIREAVIKGDPPESDSGKVREFREAHRLRLS